MCGICAAVSPTPLNLPAIIHQLTLMNNRGHEATGIATIAPDGTLSRFIGPGPAREACHGDSKLFRPFSDNFAAHPPHTFVGHTRYSTIGASTLDNGQPLCLENRNFGQFYLAHNGQVAQYKTLREKLTSLGHPFTTQSDSEVLAAIIARSTAASLPEAVAELIRQVPGAYSIIVLGQHHAVAARDRHGVWPLWFGILPNKTIVFASEEPGIKRAETTFEILPGTLVAADTRSCAYHIQKICDAPTYSCWLDAIYFKRPDEGIGEIHITGDARRALGQQLAYEAPVAADLVVGVPDSGVDAAAGFAEKSGIALEFRSLVRNRYATGRSFILPEPTQRVAAIDDKHNVVRRKVAGKKVVIVDDTIMRSTTARALTTCMQEAGAKEVHWRIAAPIVRYPCHYGINIPTKEELAAHIGSPDDIAHSIGASSLQFLSLASTLSVLNRFHSGWCTACVDGNYPIPIS